MGKTTLRLRRTWLQIHKWIGLLLALLIVPISVTGAALVWHDGLDEMLNPERRVEASAAVALGSSAYAAAARRALPDGDRIMSMRFPDGAGPVVVSSTPADWSGGRRPPRTSVWLHPADARLLDISRSDQGVVRFLHVLHGSLMIPGTGRQIVGWVGVAMLLSCVTGLWLWWPVNGSFRRGFRWRRQNATSANLHHQMGFWILVPLAMLSFTGAWISFPQFFGRFEPGAVAAAPRSARSAPSRPFAATRLSADAAVRTASAFAAGRLESVTWPTERSPEWKIAFRREGGIVEVEIDDRTEQATPAGPLRPETRARTMRRWHDGTGMGALWQAIIFIGGIFPALLAVTGIIMWIRSRGWRAERKRKRRQAGLAPQPAE